VKDPEISTIMTVHNGQLFLGQAIESILNQTFRNTELIVINDNSTDDTRQIIEDFCDQDSRIILINNPKNFGPFISANLGLKIAKGEFVARMDADDISLPIRFERQVNFLESHKEIGLLGTNGSYINETGKCWRLSGGE
jgi:glycosyltransferase involved in cell wall biosynthesis